MKVLYDHVRRNEGIGGRFGPCIPNKRFNGTYISEERCPFGMGLNVGFDLTLLLNREMRVRKNLLFNVFHEQGRARGQVRKS
jgi:hypothetical protein